MSLENHSLNTAESTLSKYRPASQTCVERITAAAYKYGLNSLVGFENMAASGVGVNLHRDFLTHSL